MGRGQREMQDPGRDFERKMEISGSKLTRFHGGKMGETWGNARSTGNQENPWIKINKTSSNQQITKKFGAIFWWGFSDFRTKSSKTRLENGGRDSKYVGVIMIPR